MCRANWRDIGFSYSEATAATNQIFLLLERLEDYLRQHLSGWLIP